MPTTPVTVTMWLDPPLVTDFQVGDMITWHASFVDRQTKAPVTPDIITFVYSSPPGQAPTPVTTPAITVDATGVCHYDLALSIVGKWILTTAPQGNPGAVSIGNQSMVLNVTEIGQ
jgi:hypothetical protein